MTVKKKRTYNFVVATDNSNLAANGAIDRTLSNLGTPCKVLNGLWCVQSTITADQLFDALSSVIDASDRIVVIPAANSWFEQNAISATQCFDLNSQDRSV